jgi:hypothetical protein
MKINEENLLITDGKETQQKQSNKWIALINIPIQMGVIIFFCLYGNWLDENYPNLKYITIKF